MGRYGIRSCAHVYIDSTKYAVPEAIGYLKGKSAIAVAKQYGGKSKNFNGEKFWVRGYTLSTVGFEPEKVKKYIAQQEELEKDQEDGKILN